MSKVTILRGCPGSGKSTYTKRNLANALVCSADHHFMIDGEYQFNRDELGEAHASCLRNFVEAIQAGIEDIVVDNTNISPTEIAPYAQLAIAYKYDLEIITLEVDATVASKRNVHGVPDKTVRNMSERMERMAKAFPPYWLHTTIKN
jgi:predicted kinase